MSWIWKTFGIYFLLFGVTFACQGHKLKINYIKNCGSENVIKLDSNATAKMTKECDIIPTACAETAGFKTAMVHYEIFKSNMPVLRGDINACEQLEKAKPEVKAMLKIFGLQEKCPFEPMKKCEDGKNKASIEMFKSLLPLAKGGPIRSEIKIQHDNGVSCFKSEIEIVKKS